MVDDEFSDNEDSSTPTPGARSNDFRSIDDGHSARTTSLSPARFSGSDSFQDLSDLSERENRIDSILDQISSKSGTISFNHQRRARQGGRLRSLSPRLDLRIIQDQDNNDDDDHEPTDEPD